VSTNGSFDLPNNPDQAQSNLDGATVVLSREVVGAITDPDPNNWSWAAVPSPQWTHPPDGSVPELEDAEARNFTYRMWGTLVQSYYFDPSINDPNTPLHRP
jgi:hypothetical protein